MPLGSALKLVAARGKLMQSMAPGGMLSVRKPADEVVGLLPPDLELAADNSPQLCVVAGPHEPLRAFASRLGELGIAAKELHTSHAFHSRMMDGAVDPFLSLVSEVPLSAPKIPIASTVTGTWLTPELATDPTYWAKRGSVCTGCSNAAGQVQ
jgi:acyl transferase domain-containing protein